MIKADNIFTGIQANLGAEFFETILDSQKIKIERIISKGHKSEPGFWYDQDDNEWVIIVTGAADIEFESEGVIHLTAGAYLNIPAHKRHRVAWTHQDEKTVWLAVHY